MRTGLRLPICVLLALAAIASALALTISPATAQQRRFGPGEPRLPALAG